MLRIRTTFDRIPIRLWCPDPAPDPNPRPPTTTSTPPRLPTPTTCPPPPRPLCPPRPLRPPLSPPPRPLLLLLVPYYCFSAFTPTFRPTTHTPATPPFTEFAGFFFNVIFSQ